MATPLYPTFEKRVNDAIEALINTQVTPWVFMTAGPPFRIKKFDGKEIAYEGIEFAGSAREVFWSRYIEPFLEHLCVIEINAVVSMAKDRGVDGVSLLNELQGLLFSGIRKVYSSMVDVDRRLRGKGYPDKAAPRPVELEIQRMNRLLDERISGEIEMWRANPMSESEAKRIYLVVPQEEAQQKLQRQAEKGRLILTALTSAQSGLALGLEQAFIKAKTEQQTWAKYTIDLLKVLSTNDELANEFGKHWIHYSLHSTQKEHIHQLVDWMNRRIARLQSIIERLPLFRIATHASSQASPTRGEAVVSKKVFLVHGHDSAVKYEVARFIEKLGLNSIILHEQADKGRTIIEKFEAHSDDVGFAVVLLTPDDVGHPKGDTSKAKARARQNVILELGFFLGTLGRHKVCALKKGDIELPTDYDGVLYKTLDEAGAWQWSLAREMREAGIAVDFEKF